MGGARADRRLLPLLHPHALVHRERQGKARAETGDLVMKKILAIVFVLLPMLCLAEEGGMVLDRAPIDLNDRISLQRGAAAFVNHCLNCHSASVMRYAR